MNAEIIAIGDEITSGQLLDTNSQWLSQRLGELGIRVLYHSTVGDELEPCADVFRRAIERADIIVATGGLGPTDDDLTREALAQTTGCELRRDAQTLEYIRSLFAGRKWPMPPQNQRQAMFPAGSRMIHNPHGTAPGIEMDVPREGRSACRIIVLPGVPAEMIEMWNDAVSPAIRALPGRNQFIRRRRIHCFGAGESMIESMLPDLIRRGRQPTVGITASKATITLRIIAEGRAKQNATRRSRLLPQPCGNVSAAWSSAKRTTTCSRSLCGNCAGNRRHWRRSSGPPLDMLAEWLGNVDVLLVLTGAAWCGRGDEATWSQVVRLCRPDLPSHSIIGFRGGLSVRWRPRAASGLEWISPWPWDRYPTSRFPSKVGSRFTSRWRPAKRSARGGSLQGCIRLAAWILLWANRC